MKNLFRPIKVYPERILFSWFALNLFSFVYVSPLSLNDGLEGTDPISINLLEMPLVVKSSAEQEVEAHELIDQLKVIEQTIQKTKQVSLDSNSEQRTILRKMEELSTSKNQIDTQLGQVIPFFKQHHLNPHQHLRTFADKLVALYATHYGEGEYDEQLDIVIPSNPTAMRKKWAELKKITAEKIGEVLPKEDDVSKNWKNSATTEELLLTDAWCIAGEIKALGDRVAYLVDGTQTSFGKNNKNIVKSRTSLSKKIKRVMDARHIPEEAAVLLINDSARGSLIVKDIPRLLQAIEAFKSEVKNKGWEVCFTNFWEIDSPMGYVGIHAKLHVPFMTRDHKIHWILAEMQFHLDSINDGTPNTTKERSHQLYELVRDLENSNAQDRYVLASILFFTSALEEMTYTQVE